MSDQTGDLMWEVVRRGALRHCAARGRGPEATKKFMEWLWRKYELAKNEDAPRKRWEYKKQNQAKWEREFAAEQKKAR